MTFDPSSLQFFLCWIGAFLLLWAVGAKLAPARFRPSGAALPLFLFLLSLHILYLSLLFEAPAEEMSAGSIPAVLAGTLSLLSGAQVVAEFRLKEMNLQHSHRELLRLFPLFFLITAYMFCIPILGFYSSSGIFLTISFLLLGSRSAPRIIALTALWSAVVFMLFSSVLQIPLPEGALF